MPRGQKYYCANCGAEVPRHLLLVKKVLFVEMGAEGKLVRSRVAHWLCPTCATADPDWNRPATIGVPRSRSISG